MKSMIDLHIAGKQPLKHTVANGLKIIRINCLHYTKFRQYRKNESGNCNKSTIEKKRNNQRYFMTRKAQASKGLGLFSQLGSDLFRAIQKQSLFSTPLHSITTTTARACVLNRQHIFVRVFYDQSIWGNGGVINAIPGTYHLVKIMGKRIKGRNPLNMHRIFEMYFAGGFYRRARRYVHIGVNGD